MVQFSVPTFKYCSAIMSSFRRLSSLKMCNIRLFLWLHRPREPLIKSRNLSSLQGSFKFLLKINQKPIGKNHQRSFNLTFHCPHTYIQIMSNLKHLLNNRVYKRYSIVLPCSSITYSFQLPLHRMCGVPTLMYKEKRCHFELVEFILICRFYLIQVKTANSPPSQ